MDNESLVCAVCGGSSSLLDVVDFNKSCEEAKGKFLPLAGVPVYYALCGSCGFCFAPEIAKWSLDEFAQRIYNNQYTLVDPDYIEVRPREHAATLLSMFGNALRSVRHLDYGGGDGTLVEILRKSGWDSTSYDPFVNRDTRPDQLGQFELITAFEVFEHVPDVQELMSQLRSLLSPNGVVLFTTLLSDGNIHPNQRIGWWYASPRNGHISLFSRDSLAILAQGSKFNVGSFDSGVHAFFTEVPPWASHVIRINAEPSIEH
jgi:SAM-dependent methyltransferase